MPLPLQVFGIDGFGGLALALVVPIVLVALGTYVGVLMALQSFFDASSWQEAASAARDEQ
jgi:hypothetical protein